MTVAAPAVGALLIALVLRELFHTLFHPAGRGDLSMAVFRLVWRLARRTGGRALRLAGPVAMVLVIALWGGGLLLGCALVYWPFLPGSFIFASPLEPGTQGAFVDALYFSLVTQATLGYGDIVPRDDLLRIVAPLQAIVGFGLFTGAITWVLSVYPALARQRTTAALIAVAAKARQSPEHPEGATPPAFSSRSLQQATGAIAACRVDLLQYPSTFYYAAPDCTTSLAATLPWLAAVATGVESEDEEIRLAATELSGTIDQFAATVADEFLDLNGAATDQILRAYGEHLSARRP